MAAVAAVSKVKADVVSTVVATAVLTMMSAGMFVARIAAAAKIPCASCALTAVTALVAPYISPAPMTLVMFAAAMASDLSTAVPTQLRTAVPAQLRTAMTPAGVPLTMRDVAALSRDVTMAAVATAVAPHVPTAVSAMTAVSASVNSTSIGTCAPGSVSCEELEA